MEIFDRKDILEESEINGAETAFMSALGAADQAESPHDLATGAEVGVATGTMVSVWLLAHTSAVKHAARRK
jgi:hypothetical protein